MTGRRWRVWCLWSDLSEILVDLGPEYGAQDPDEARAVVARRGLVSGYGLRPSYHGTHAVEVRQ
jgi:hypothetical protein